MEQTAEFAAYAIALYAAHHVGDYWVQTHDQSMKKGCAGSEGRAACRRHVASYLLTQSLFLMAVDFVTGAHASTLGVVLALVISGVTHYAADRREYGIMFKLARRMPWKAGFLDLGVPRPKRVHHLHGMYTETGRPCVIEVTDNPSLGTGAWALDQSWHIFWGVFVAALVMVGIG